jgi:hypothetical protein
MIKNELPYSKEDYYVGAQGNPELNIDITENGDYDVRKYSTAKVNVSSGGGDYPIITGTWDENLENYTYSCDWSFNELKAKLEEQTESNNWAGIFVDTSRDGTMGGTYSKESATRLTFLMSDGSELIYKSDGTITDGII